MSKQGTNRALMWTIFLIALIQMAHLAITPAIDLIATEIFPEKSFQTIQTAMSLPSILSIFGGIISVLLVRYGIVSKKALVIAGISSIALAGVAALILHTQYWHLGLFKILIGIGMGSDIPAIQCILFDSFAENARRFLSGTQAAFINCGGILMSVVGGILTTYVWYGGHLVMLFAIPVLVVSLITVPRDEPIKSVGKDSKATKLPKDVYYYAFLIFVFMIMYNVGAMNLSTHLASWNIGNSATAGVATALMMAGGVISGLLFSRISPILRDNVFSFSYVLLSIGFTLLSLFPRSLPMTLIAMFITGASLSLYIPRCVFNVSNITDPTNSATATILMSCLAPGIGSFLSPVIMTNLTFALGGSSTRFRYQFTGIVCIVIAVIIFINNGRRENRSLFSKEK